MTFCCLANILTRLISFSFLFFWNLYRIDESEADKNERLDKWQKYLESEDAKKEIDELNQQTIEASTSEKPQIESSWKM